jgi:hypothetical protein
MLSPRIGSVGTGAHLTITEARRSR